MQTVGKKEKSMETLVKMGMVGHFPLFDHQWLLESFTGKRELTRSLSQKDKAKARKLMNRLLQHASLEKQKTALLAMSEEERFIVIRSLFTLVEGKLLDGNPMLQ